MHTPREHRASRRHPPPKQSFDNLEPGLVVVSSRSVGLIASIPRLSSTKELQMMKSRLTIVLAALLLAVLAMPEFAEAQGYNVRRSPTVS